jgi:hypothetical protein
LRFIKTKEPTTRHAKENNPIKRVLSSNMMMVERMGKRWFAGGREVQSAKNEKCIQSTSSRSTQEGGRPKFRKTVSAVPFGDRHFVASAEAAKVPVEEGRRRVCSLD